MRGAIATRFTSGPRSIAVAVLAWVAVSAAPAEARSIEIDDFRVDVAVWSSWFVGRSLLAAVLAAPLLAFAGMVWR